MYANTYSRMAVIARDKLTGFGEHWGILLPTGYVAHNTDERNTHVVTFEEFAAGKPVKVIREVPPSEHRGTYWRLQAELAAARPYDLLQYNCEIFANTVTGYKPESPQVKGWALLALLALVVRIAA
ncbi:MAG: hypothetical protein A2937_03625 [Candidatus Yonathbacteria bacterium RIFCSPLOWO2_01_FULL_47_33b]|uniref:LRAT domain-containing protein n=1 Tax=Candidatus Yonathbacteria bacterium RIFCSPLOWO2_01_FULL_47_33b TaxID=1802727 RepID=A0A1G2SE96_9BACT|nr:MAG: hypothetical protein A2937_03625 [Candidatus Yonathbacteria bacterium RIFCSPLOWO2_01_FULL_47_33b]